MTKAEMIKILENYNDYTEIHLINSCQDIDMGTSLILNTVIVERSNFRYQPKCNVSSSR